MSSLYRSWDRVYHEYPLGELPLELGKPRPVLVQLIEEGFEATGLDVSHKAIEYMREKP